MPEPGQLTKSGGYTQNSSLSLIRPANTPPSVATIADMPRERGLIIVKGKKAR